MSRYSLRPADPALTDTVLVGWDPRLETFYARVVPSAHAPPEAPSVWIGTDRHQIRDPSVVITAIAPHAVVPDDLARLLNADAGPPAGGSSVDSRVGSRVDSRSEDVMARSVPDHVAAQRTSDGSGGGSGGPFGPAEFVRRIAASGFDQASAAQIAREYADALTAAARTPAGTAVGGWQFHAHHVADAVEEFHWVDCNRGESLAQARTRAAATMRAWLERAERLDPARQPGEVAHAFQNSLLWAQRSRPLREAIQDPAVNPTVHPALSLTGNPAQDLPVLNVLLAAQWPPERVLAVELARAQQILHGLADGASDGAPDIGTAMATQASAGGSTVIDPHGGAHQRALVSGQRERVRQLTERAIQLLSQPIRLTPKQPLGSTPSELAHVYAAMRARRVLRGLACAGPASAAHARDDLLQRWPRHDMDLLAKKATAERAGSARSGPPERGRAGRGRGSSTHASGVAQRGAHRVARHAPSRRTERGL